MDNALTFFFYIKIVYCGNSSLGCFNQLLVYLCLRSQGSTRGYGIRVTQSAQGSDSWVDDPIMRHIICLRIGAEEEGESYLLWPLVLHVRGPYCVLALPLIEPRHLKVYSRLCCRSDCGNAVGVDESISSLLLDLPSITGYGKL